MSGIEKDLWRALQRHTATPRRALFERGNSSQVNAVVGPGHWVLTKITDLAQHRCRELCCCRLFAVAASENLLVNGPGRKQAPVLQDVQGCCPIYYETDSVLFDRGPRHPLLGAAEVLHSV